MHEELRRTHHGLEQIAVGVDAVNCEKLEGHHDIAVGERVVHRADLKLHAVREEVAVEMMMQSREHEVDPLLPRTLRLEPELGKHRHDGARPTRFSYAPVAGAAPCVSQIEDLST